MGVLDDAIREHLELKRRHGSDPVEVSRLEREALGPVTAAELEALVRLAGTRWVPTANVDPSGQWAAEPGLGLLDPAPGAVAALLLRFAQYAAVVIERGGPARLQWHP